MELKMYTLAYIQLPEDPNNPGNNTHVKYTFNLEYDIIDIYISYGSNYENDNRSWYGGTNTYKVSGVTELTFPLTDSSIPVFTTNPISFENVMMSGHYNGRPYLDVEEPVQDYSYEMTSGTVDVNIAYNNNKFEISMNNYPIPQNNGGNIKQTNLNTYGVTYSYQTTLENSEQVLPEGTASISGTYEGGQKEVAGEWYGLTNIDLRLTVTREYVTI